MSGTLSSLLAGRGSKHSAPVRRFAPKATPVGDITPAPVRGVHQTLRPPAAPHPDFNLSEPISDATSSAFEEGAAVSEEIPPGIMRSPTGQSMTTPAVGCTVRLAARPARLDHRGVAIPMGATTVPSSSVPTVRFGENIVHTIPRTVPHEASVSESSTKEPQRKTLKKPPDAKKGQKGIAMGRNIESEANENKKRIAYPAIREVIRQNRTKHSGCFNPVFSPLPSAFGEDTSYTVHTVYLKKTEMGVGLRLKNIEGKAVVKGMADHFPSTAVLKNDVIMAVNELDSRTASFDAIVDKFRWTPRVGDWCGLHSGSDMLAAQNAVIVGAQRKRSGSTDDTPVDSHRVPASQQYMQLTTPEQDIMASYPVKLSRVEDVVCVKLARPVVMRKSSRKDGVAFI